MLIASSPLVFVHLFHGLVLCLLGVSLLLLARLVFTRTTALDPSAELIDHTNSAYGIYLGGFLAGTAIALAGTLFGRQAEPLLPALGNMLCEGLLLIALLRLSISINDRLILFGFSLAREISEDHNRGAAFCVGGSCLAGGLILNGALTSYSSGLFLALRDTILLWVIGQIILVVGALLYRRLAHFDIHQLIQFDNNAAAGLRFGTYLAALGLVLRGALVRAPMIDLKLHGPQTLLLALGGLLSFVILYPFGRQLTLLGQSSEEEVDMHGNMAVSLADAAVTLSIALLVAFAIQRVPLDVS